MRRILLAALFITSSLMVFSQEEQPGYDPALAAKLGADDLGMKTYVLVILKSGPAKIEDKELRDSLFRGHFSNMDKLAGEGKLVTAGPFSANDNQYRGLFLSDVRTIEEAEELVRGDPTVTNGIFVTEMYQWYGTAAMPLLLEIHPKLQKRKP
ncbi:MAG: YciI family protein [Bacteroidales bacterium]|jgi:uncharacterized protein YciI|nr:YciI family protein [Bacteroidales bacterium]